MVYAVPLDQAGAKIVKGVTAMATTEEILNQLLSLPLDTRARVAQRLLESLESADDTNRRLWDAEIESRLDAYERGELQAVPGDEVLARLREKFPRKN
jgi:putative addiction module component (TIGR02574 family)